MSNDPRSLARGTTIGGWEIQRRVADRPWPEAKAERADGTQARLMIIPSATVPDAATLAGWRAALSPGWLDHPAFPSLRGVGHDATAGAVWIARAWTPWNPFAAVLAGTVALPEGRRGAALLALGEALAVLHRGGVAHGALAPARVLLARADGSACEVLDLGLATVAAGLGLRPPGALRPPEDQLGAAGDVHAFAAIVEAMLVERGPGRLTWRGRLASWCAEVARAPAAARPTIEEALVALRAILPEPEPPEPPPPPIPPPSARELAIIEAQQRKREAEVEARHAALHRELDPPRHGEPPTDRNPPFVPPIVSGGPALEPGAWLALVRARRPAAVIAIDADHPGTLVTGPVTWYLGQGQTVAAAEAIADAIASALDALAGKLGGGDLDAELRASALAPVEAWPVSKRYPEPRPGGERWWHRPGTRVIVSRAAVRVQRERSSWVTSHELGTVGDTAVELATAGIPRDRGARARLLAAMLTVTGRVDERPSVTYVCRFCRRSFAGLHFHAELGACHGCSEHHLHIVH